MIEKQIEREILLIALATPDYALIEFFQKMQKKLDWSPAIFCQMMAGACEYYLNEIWKMGYERHLSLFDAGAKIGRMDFPGGNTFGQAQILQMQATINKAFDEPISTSPIGEIDRPSRTQALIDLYKKKGKDLTQSQVYALAEKYGYMQKSMWEHYLEYHTKIKDSAT